MIAKRTLWVAVATATLVHLTSCGDSDKAASAREAVHEAGKATAEYIQQTVIDWKRDLGALDDDLAAWKQAAERMAQDADEEVRQNLQDARQALEEKQKALAARLAEAGNATSDSWDAMQTGFERGCAEFRKELENAKKLIH